MVVELLQNAQWKKPFEVLPVEEDEEDSAGTCVFLTHLIADSSPLSLSLSSLSFLFIQRGVQK